MSISHDFDKNIDAPDFLRAANSAPGSLRFEATDEHKSTQDDADMARFGKRSQLNVCLPV